ncbi:OmpA family protein [Paracoccus lutimaris]|uniref:OmpA family protein n=1 Tax=Paracoccus lutimaris TaxID=1490030 RepID=A0A368ZBU0_9RHOB|nr:OmpA family protein [Paracoccus lutimaris]RCW88966.1 OmpA family protein [Paracoccus lutimaris]
MRRIYKTTTAIVACMALVTPQFAVAQEQTAPEKLILPQGQPEQPAAEQPTSIEPEVAAEPEAPAAAQDPASEEPTAEAQVEQQEQTPPEMQQPAAEPAEPQPEAAAKAAPETAAETAPQPQAEAQPKEQPAPVAEAPVEPAPEQKPAVTQADEPKEKPAIVQADTPAAKPENAAEAAGRVETLETGAQKTPQPKPDSAKAVTQTDPAPSAKPKTPRGEPAQPGAATAEPIGADALRKKLEAETGQGSTETAKPTEPALKPAAKPAPQADAGQPTELPAELPAPEVQAEPNAVAQRAAEQVAPPTAAALAATSGEAQGQLNEIAITQENARSSAEDFATTVAQGLQPGATAQARDKDDDDDNKRDIAKLLLAGAAGFAVGKMLSNDREVALNTGDRVVVTLPDGSQQVIKDDNALLYRPGSNVQTETFQDGSTRTTVLREDGSRVVTIRDANMNTLRRTLIRADGSETQLIDDTTAEPVRISTLPAPPPVKVISRPLDEDALREALRRETAVDRRFSLGQVRDIPEVRALVAPVNVPEVTFDTGSSAITPDQAQQLATLGKVIRDSIDQNPREIYMIEGYTDAVGSNAANLALSDRRAESIALALTEYFQVPPENMVVQGYGEQFLLIPTDGPERQNRRVAVRRITQLLAAN